MFHGKLLKLLSKNITDEISLTYAKNTRQFLIFFFHIEQNVFTVYVSDLLVYNLNLDMNPKLLETTLKTEIRTDL